MTILTPDVQYVIGVDTHKDTHTVAVLAARTGALLGRTTCPADAAGYAQICRYAERKAPGATVWAVEGTGSYGAGPPARCWPSRSRPPRGHAATGTP